MVTTPTSDSDIVSIMPHDPPMVLLDRMIDGSEDEFIAEVQIRDDHPFNKPPHGVPSYLALELMAQAVAAHSGFCSRALGEPVKIGLLLGTRDLRLTRPWFAVGESLTVTVTVSYRDEEMGSYLGAVMVAGKECARASLNVYQPRSEQDLVARITGERPE